MPSIYVLIGAVYGLFGLFTMMRTDFYLQGTNESFVERIFSGILVFTFWPFFFRR